MASMALYGRVWPVWPCRALVTVGPCWALLGPVWPYSLVYGGYGPVWPYSLVYGGYGPIGPVWPYSLVYRPYGPYWPS